MGSGEPTAAVTAAEMVAGHVTLDISCVDRLYLNGYVPRLQTPGGVIYFFHDHRGKPIVSPALFEPIGEKFRKDMNDWAQANGIPVVRFRAGDRKADVMDLDAAAATGCSQVAAIGCAQEFQLVWMARKRDTDPGKPPQFSFTKEQRRVSVFYVCIWDSGMGGGFIKICTYFPHPVKALVNGREWAKRQAAAHLTAGQDENDVVLIVDETADEKSSVDCAGAARQYSGTVGGIATCQVAVSLTCASPAEHTLIGRALYLPAD